MYEDVLSLFLFICSVIDLLSFNIFTVGDRGQWQRLKVKQKDQKEDWAAYRLVDWLLRIRAWQIFRENYFYKQLYTRKGWA